MTDVDPAKLVSGYKADESKTRLELLPPEFLWGTAAVLTFGAKKYEDRNWEKGMKWSRAFGALMRHMWAWWGGKAPTTKSFLFGDLDTETGMSHLWHAGCCLAFLMAYEERGMTEWDDRFTGPDAITPASGTWSKGIGTPPEGTPRADQPGPIPVPGYTPGERGPVPSDREGR